MNCRRINSLLSSYMDAELSNGEMQAIKNHLNDCGKCRREYETLQETKSLVASLAIRAPRAELNELLESSLQQSAPPSLTDRVSWWWEENVANREGLRVRPHTMAATALFSFAGLWLATVSLDGPHDWHRRTPTPDYRLTPGVAVFGITCANTCGCHQRGRKAAFTDAAIVYCD